MGLTKWHTCRRFLTADMLFLGLVAAAAAILVPDTSWSQGNEAPTETGGLEASSASGVSLIANAPPVEISPTQSIKSDQVYGWNILTLQPLSNYETNVLVQAPQLTEITLPAGLPVLQAFTKRLADISVIVTNTSLSVLDANLDVGLFAPGPGTTFCFPVDGGQAELAQYETILMDSVTGVRTLELYAGGQDTRLILIIRGNRIDSIALNTNPDDIPTFYQRLPNLKVVPMNSFVQTASLAESQIFILNASPTAGSVSVLIYASATRSNP